MQPRRNDKLYKTTLYFQYAIYGLLINIIELFFSRRSFLEVVGYLVVWITLLLFAEKVRSWMASKPDDELSKIMTIAVLKGGLFIGLGQVREINAGALWLFYLTLNTFFHSSPSLFSARYNAKERQMIGGCATGPCTHKQASG